MTIEHILVRHEQGAGHMAEGYARSTGKPGVVLVTSGPGATNVVTALQDALMDSIPLVCITGQVPDLADRLRRLPGMRHRRHHPAVHQAQLAGQGRQPALPRHLHEAFRMSPPPDVPGRSSSTFPRMSSSPPASTPRRRR
jgi:glyoxylate carboligase